MCTAHSGSDDEASRSSDDGPATAHSRALDRRTVLRGLGVAGVGVGLGPTRATGAKPSPAASSAHRATALPEGIRPVPVRGGCTAAVGDAPCTDGTVGLYDSGGEVGYGQHTYQLTVNDIPLGLYSDSVGIGLLSLAHALPVQRLPQPPAGADPDWGPYELMLNGVGLTLDATEDLAAPVRVVPPDCEVPPACRTRWCRAVGQTVDALRDRSEALDLALIEANTNLAGEVFRVTVPSLADEQAALTQLAAQVQAALLTEAALLRADIAGTDQSVDVPEACGDCPTCVRMPRAHRVRSWDFRVEERSSAQWTIDESRHWAHHELRTQFVLEPPGVAGAAHVAEGGGGPLGGLLGAILSALNGAASALGGLGGGTPDRRSWMGKPVEAEGWINQGYVGQSSGNTVGVRSAASGTVTDPERLTQFADLVMDFEAEEYELSLPYVPLTGESRTFGLPSDTDSSFDPQVGYGDTITRRAAQLGVGGAKPAPEDEAGDQARFPLAEASECGSGLSHEVEVPLEGRGVISTNVTGRTLPAEMGPQGTASVAWELTPREIEDGEMRRIDCL